MNYVDMLLKDGDPTEKLGVKEYNLGEKFPRYAEFWGSYVVPNRDSDPSKKHKLRDGFPVKIEEIFNTHYSIFYQLTFGYAQIEHLTSVQLNDLVDVASPFYHLATTIDLIEKLFVTVFRLDNPHLIKPLDEESYNQRVKKFWNTSYQKFFNDFNLTFRSVTFNLHDAKTLFDNTVPESAARTNFNKARDTIRQYRNKFIHGVSPLRLWNGKEICFPKLEHLSNYSGGHWSSKWDAIDSEHYEPAVSLLGTLADELVKAADVLWKLLIEEIQPHVPMPEAGINFHSLATFIPTENLYTGGTLTHYAPPPTNPSGIKFDNTGGSAVFPNANMQPDSD